MPRQTLVNLLFDWLIDWLIEFLSFVQIDLRLFFTDNFFLCFIRSIWSERTTGQEDSASPDGRLHTAPPHHRNHVTLVGRLFEKSSQTKKAGGLEGLSGFVDGAEKMVTRVRATSVWVENSPGGIRKALHGRRLGPRTDDDRWFYWQVHLYEAKSG